jgi:hypothetical protein
MQVFGQFGSLAGPRAVNLKSQKDKPSFAFIEFAQASSASTAISTPVRPTTGTMLAVVNLAVLRHAQGGFCLYCSPSAGEKCQGRALLVTMHGVRQVQVDGQTVRVDEKKPLYMLRGGRGGRFGDGGRGGGRFDGGRGGYYGRGPGGRGGPVVRLL